MSLLSRQFFFFFTHLAERGEQVLFSIPRALGGGRVVGGVFWSAGCALINLPKRHWRWKHWRASCSGSPESLVQPEALLRRLLFFSSLAARNLGRAASARYRCALASLLVLVDYMHSWKVHSFTFWVGGGAVVIPPAGEEHNTLFFCCCFLFLERHLTLSSTSRAAGGWWALSSARGK